MAESLAAAITGAESRLAAFGHLIAGIPYERKGILNSEMFFLWLCAETIQPKRILESGRAQGQSTLILARCFPQAEIISVEHDRNSPDVLVAAERLQHEGNVTLLFGDATRVLREMAGPGDIALIDGPKGLRGVRLALSLLGTGKLPLVFVHDAGLDSVERRFFDRWLPSVRYSDEPDLASHSHVLDDETAVNMPPAKCFSACDGRSGYGYGLACLSYAAGSRYGMLRWRAALAGLQRQMSAEAPGR